MIRFQRALVNTVTAGATLLIAAGCAGNPQRPVDPTTTGAIATSQDVSSSPAAPAMQDGPLTFESSVWQAVAWHPSVTETVSRLQQQNANLDEARSGYLPRVNWGLDSAYDSETSRGYRPLLNVSGSQMIYDFGKVETRVKIAEVGITGRRAQIFMAVDELARDTAHAFIEVRRAEALRKVARDQISDTREILELVEARTDRGASTRSDELQARSRVQAAEAALAEIEAQLARWQGVLASATGRAGTVRLSGAFPSWLRDVCTRGQPDWSSMPAIMQAEADAQAAGLEIDLSRAESMPTLSLDGRIGSDVSRIGSTDPEYRVALNVSGSLYNGGESAARGEAAVHAQAASQAAVSRVRLDVARNLAEATSQISSLRQLQASLGARESVMRETRQLYQTQYLELGTRSLLDVVNAAQELHAASLDRTNIEHDLHRLNADCTFNAGRTREAFSLTGMTVQGQRL